MARKKKLNKKGKRFFSILFILIIAAVAIIICLNLRGKAKVETADKDEEVEVKTPKVVEKLKILDLDSKTRPYAIMINNISTVWGYQCGLQDAYMVYEIIVEGGYTRLMAVFKDKDLDRLGSVRSSRHYFLDYALENDAIYVHFGWSPQAESDMKSLGVNNINFMSFGGYTRDYSLGLATEHTAFTTTSEIMRGADYYGYRTTSDAKPVLNYSVKELDLSVLEGAVQASTIDMVYSPARSTSFEYDPENKVYKRFQNGVAHKDYITGLQYTAKNIITYQVPNYTIYGDNKGRQTLDNIGSGDGWFISNGYAVPITWEKQSRSSKTKYKYLDGTEIEVNDGNTYIQIQPSGQDLTIE